MSQPVGRPRPVHAADGTTLHATDFLLPRAQQSGSVVLMHGLGEHSGRYLHVVRFFNDCGLSVRSYDHRGHGKSGGKRGDVVNGDPMVQDAQIVIDDFASNFAEPPYLFGHSMGGLFATRLALSGMTPLRGLILSSPALALTLSPIEQRLLKIMQVIAPSFGAPNGLSPKHLSRDPQVGIDYSADPLVHGRISARLLRSMLSAMAFCQIHAGELAIQTLMVVAGDDHLVNPEGSKQFFAKAPAGMATMHFYEHFYHEVFNEPAAGRAFYDLRAWLTAQLAAVAG